MAVAYRQPKAKETDFSGTSTENLQLDFGLVTLIFVLLISRTVSCIAFSTLKLVGDMKVAAGKIVPCKLFDFCQISHQQYMRVCNRFSEHVFS